MVLYRHLDGGSDAGGELGRLEAGKVYEPGSAAAGADAAGDLHSVDGVLLPAGRCGEAAEDTAVLHRSSGGGGMKKKQLAASN